MAKEDDWWPAGRAALLVVLGLATGTAVIPRSSGSSSGPSERTAPRSITAVAEKDAAGALAGTEPVVALLAESLGVDLDNAQAREAATTWRDYLCLKMTRGPSAAEARLVAALDVVLTDLGAPAAHLDAHSSHPRRTLPSSADALALLRANARFDIGDAEMKKRKAALIEYFDADTRDLPTIERVQAAAAARGIHLNAFVAMLPDYVDSQTRRLFDSGLGGIQQAAGTLGYSLDRFYLPDSGAAGADESAAHRSSPGALIFRRTETDANTGAHHDRLLLALIVTEMPTLGVHRDAFTAAVALIDAWHAAAAKQRRDYALPATRPDLNIVGPFFSGSVSSLKESLEEIARNDKRLNRQVRIVSGTATDPLNGPRLRSVAMGRINPDGRGDDPVGYHAIVPDNNVVSESVLQYLTSINPQWACGSGVAILVEGNTKFGLSVIERMPAASTKAADVKALKKVSATVAPADPVQSAEDAGCGRPLQFVFPLHVSRLRAATDTDSPALPLLTPPAVRLKLSESAQPKDLVPAMTPDMTAALVDSALDNLFAALKRERYTAIGIFATDARDHLFLARKISRIVPDVQMFGTQADLLYINPEFAPFLKGTLIATSYPLFNETQLLTMPKNAFARRQFTTASEQGIYNSMLSLVAPVLAREQQVTLASTGLIDATEFSESCYHTDAGCAPPVWLTVVGSHAIWPIRRTDHGGRARFVSPDSSRPAFAAAVAPSWAVAASVALFGAALLHVAGCYFAVRRHERVRSRRAPLRLSRAAFYEVESRLADRCGWRRSRLFWNFHAPSHVTPPTAARFRLAKETRQEER